MLLKYTIVILHIFFYNTISTMASITIRPITKTDIPSALDLDIRVSMEYFKPLFVNNYPHNVLGQDPEYCLGLDIAHDRTLFADCAEGMCKEKLYIAWDEIKQNVAGLIVFHQEDPTLIEIDLLLIDKEYRRNKLGKQLLTTALEYFKDSTMCGVYVFSANKEAITFYQSLGFKNTGPVASNQTTIYGISSDQVCVYLQRLL